MNDKWNIVYEDGDINFLRSWTNTLVYKAHLVKKTRKTHNISDIMYNNDVVSSDNDYGIVQYIYKKVNILFFYMKYFQISREI